MIAWLDERRGATCSLLDLMNHLTWPLRAHRRRRSHSPARHRRCRDQRRWWGRHGALRRRQTNLGFRVAAAHGCDEVAGWYGADWQGWGCHRAWVGAAMARTTQAKT